MGEKYIFKWANDSINEVFKPLWLNDTTYHLPNHINAEVSWYETKCFLKMRKDNATMLKIK